MKIPFPVDYGTKGCALVAIDISMLPIIAGLLKPLEEARSWQAEDYQQGYRAITTIEACMTALCVQQLVDSNDRLYRLLDAGLFGRVYEASGDDPPIITPSIPVVPDMEFANPGALGKLEHIDQGLQSFVGGIDTPNYSGTPNVLALLQGVIDAINAQETDNTEIIEDLVEIIALLG